MRFASLGSGSKGNGTLVEHGRTCILVDSGFSLAQVKARLARLGRTIEELTAILVTHEHSDHVRGVATLARHCNAAVWMTPGTAAHCEPDMPRLQHFSCHQPFAIDELWIEPFPVPHDAREPSQFVFSDGARRLGMLTDVGSSTRHIEATLSRCDALLLECNHDEQMLQQGSYPPPLKKRVGGEHGHLSNAQAAQLLGRIDCSVLQHVVAAHLSEENNTPLHAQRALGTALGCQPQWIAIADQQQGLAWRHIS
ncbi:MAG: MBL fold metallo-hydrolase [Gammaproteobacteria bacterium]|nr:MBL fold metallo-hydrolase [Gammaproteobacteria bacterium]